MVRIPTRVERVTMRTEVGERLRNAMQQTSAVEQQPGDALMLNGWQR